MDTHKAKKYVAKLWKEWRLTIFLIIFVVIPVKSSLADWNWVPTGSMNPTILEGDLIYVNKIAYGLRFPLTFHRLAQWADPQRGDIVVCFSPEDRSRLVKRIIALPGDTVELKNNRLLLNGRPLNYSPIDSKYTVALSAAQKNTAVLSRPNYSIQENKFKPVGCYKPLTCIRTEYNDVRAVIKSVFLSLPPKQTFEGFSGTSIV